ncbi:hypothetical protein CDG81_20110 [Actinopolyspora erythraea]|uniref:Mce-associated membrane protein n=1 Tax=Actinopolyspora erythraea TaxID=414996 RepID=A0A099D9H2_9ACTN|nr:hypothetical protein [Actinopolyspora erythraea]ASU80192.1 hypothetical protein CDG81_20110 [Actinopolyspora erythraea]KGI82442.1 hypothetical protein IL38_04780 [Actinopolyspora erythraea]
MRSAVSTPSRPRRWRTVPVAVVLLLASLLAAGGFGVSWALAANDSSVQLAATRDRVLRAGRQAVINFNSIDHRRVRQDMSRAIEGTTGPLREVLEGSREQRVERVTKNKSVTEAEILASALTELNERQGKARMIASYKITKIEDGGKPTTSRWRVRAELSRTDGQWKLSRMTPSAG